MGKYKNLEIEMLNNKGNVNKSNFKGGKPKVIDLFSGISVLGLGYSDEFDIVLSVEKEKNAAKTLEENKAKYHPNATIINKDIFDVNDEFISEYKGVDGIIGGPPCQPFSAAKNTFNPDDARITCLFQYLHWVKIIEPKFFMLENTDGLTQKNKVYILNEFLELAKNLNYKVNYKVLNAHDYGNVQNRKRIIIVGFRDDLEVNYEFPKPIAESCKRYLKDIIVQDEEVGDCLSYSQKRAYISSFIPQGGNWRNLKTEELLREALGGNYEKREGGMSGVYRRLSLENGYKCPTLVTNPLQRNTLAIHPLEVRPLSVKEYMRGQGIPEDYKIIGSVNEKYKYIGNAVPYELAKAIADSIYSSLVKAGSISFKPENLSEVQSRVITLDEPVDKPVDDIQSIPLFQANELILKDNMQYAFNL